MAKTNSDRAKLAQELVKICEDAGWRTKQVKHGVMVFPPDKTKKPIVISMSAQDHRALDNNKSRLRAAGLEID